MKIEVYDTTLLSQAPGDRYAVALTDWIKTGDIETWDMCVYYMSDDANMPNGICIYAGDNPKAIPANSKQLQLGDMPRGVLLKIIDILSTFRG